MKEAVFFVVNMRISLETVNPTKPRKYERVPCVGRGVPAVHRSRRHSVVSQTHSTAELCAVKSADPGSCMLLESKVPTQGLRTQMTFCLGQESVCSSSVVFQPVLLPMLCCGPALLFQASRLPLSDKSLSTQLSCFFSD